MLPTVRCKCCGGSWQTPVDLAAGLLVELRELVAADRKITAMQQLRSRTNVDITSAKAVVQHLSTQPGRCHRCQTALAGALLSECTDCKSLNYDCQGDPNLWELGPHIAGSPSTPYSGTTVRRALRIAHPDAAPGKTIIEVTFLPSFDAEVVSVIESGNGTGNVLLATPSVNLFQYRLAMRTPSPVEPEPASRHAVGRVITGQLDAATVDHIRGVTRGLDLVALERPTEQRGCDGITTEVRYRYGTDVDVFSQHWCPTPTFNRSAYDLVHLAIWVSLSAVNDPDLTQAITTVRRYLD